MFDHLLLAIDGSPGSDLATDFTAALAQRCEASVHLLHVNEYLVGGRGLTLRTDVEATELITTTVRILAAAGVRATGTTFPASYREVAAHIVSVAQHRGADAIVLGSHRQRWIGRLFAPQVRERVTRRTSLPVLTAPAPLTLGSSQSLTVEGMRHKTLAPRPPRVEHPLG
jgi:nucleotide-binding universal stress UspA family protein